MEEKKTTGKRMLRIVVVMLAVIMATSTLVGATIGRYSVFYETSDTTRVVLWFGDGHIVENAIVLDLFDMKYYGRTPDPTSTTDVVSATDASGNARRITVSSSDERKVIAPGTSGRFTFDMSAFFTGRPEVDYTLKVVIGNWGGDRAMDRLVFYLDGKKCGSYWSLSVALNRLEVKYKAYEKPLSRPEAIHTISWEWPFETDKRGDNLDTKYGVTDTDEVYVELRFYAIQDDVMNQ